MIPFSPSSDTLIVRRYGSHNLDQKVENKTALQLELGWPAEPRRPLVCFPAGMSDQLGGNLLAEILPGLLSLPIELLILGKGSQNYGALFTKLAQDNSHRVHILADTELSEHTMYAASDIALFLAPADKQKELTNCLSYGTVPVAPEGSHLENYDAVQEAGNAFLYESPTVWNCYAALVRAIETYKFPFDWRTIQRHAMETVARK